MSEGGARARRRIAASCLAVAAAGAALAGGELLARRLVPHIARQDAAGPLAALEVGSHLIVEYGARGRRFVPGARVVVHNAPLSHQDVVLEIDSRGLRDREIPQRRRRGELRVLALGDSITAVDYLPAEQGWVEVLERALAPRWSGPVEVVNAGMGNVGLGEELALLEDVGLALEPQIVLLAFYLNDGNPSWSFSSDVADRGWLRRYSVLADFVTTSLQLLRLRWSGGQESPFFAWVRAQDELPWRTDRAALLELARLAGADWGAAWSDPSGRAWSKGWESWRGSRGKRARASWCSRFRSPSRCTPTMSRTLRSDGSRRLRAGRASASSTSFRCCESTARTSCSSTSVTWCRAPTHWWPRRWATSWRARRFPRCRRASLPDGEVAERSKAAVLKTARRSRVSRVRIPPSPPLAAGRPTAT